MPLLSNCKTCEQPFPSLIGAFIEINGMKYHLGDYCSRYCMNQDISLRISQEVR
jgi:hypothetical protein